MILEDLKTVFDRDLTKLKDEIEGYENEADLWMLAGTINNSGGNLCLHMCGNLQHFVGAKLGGIDYERERDKEFSLRDVPMLELIQQIERTRQAVKITLDKLSPSSLELKYPINVFGYEISTAFFLLHLSTHLSYHLGQLNYHRRLIAG